MVYDDVLRLDISMDNFNHVVAVVQSLNHIKEVIPQLCQPNALIFTVLWSILSDTKLVVPVENLVFLIKSIGQRPSRVVLCNQVDMVAIRIINYFVKINNVRVLKSL